MFKEGLLSDDIICIKYKKVETKGILVNNFIFCHHEGQSDLVKYFHPKKELEKI